LFIYFEVLFAHKSLGTGACVFLAFGVNHTGSPVLRSASYFVV